MSERVNDMRRTLIVIATVVVVGALACWAGWVNFASSEGKASVTVDSNEMKKDAQDAVEAGKDLLDKTSESAGETIDATRRPESGSDVPESQSVGPE
jgi:hypothetical protein